MGWRYLAICELILSAQISNSPQVQLGLRTRPAAFYGRRRCSQPAYDCHTTIVHSDGGSRICAATGDSDRGWFGNLMSSDSSTVVTVSRGLGSGALLGTLSRTASNGLVSFTSLSYNVAETISLNFSSGGLTGTASSNVVVSSAAANRLTIQTQPGGIATAGAFLHFNR